MATSTCVYDVATIEISRCTVQRGRNYKYAAYDTVTMKFLDETGNVTYELNLFAPDGLEQIAVTKDDRLPNRKARDE